MEEKIKKRKFTCKHCNVRIDKTYYGYCQTCYYLGIFSIEKDII